MFGIPNEKFCKQLYGPEELCNILSKQGTVVARLWLSIRSDYEHESEFTRVKHCIYEHSYIAKHRRTPTGRSDYSESYYPNWVEVWNNYINNPMWADACGHRINIYPGEVKIYVPCRWSTDRLKDEDLESRGIHPGTLTKYKAYEKVLTNNQVVQIMGRFTLMDDGTIRLESDINCPAAISLTEQINSEHSVEIENQTRNIAKSFNTIVSAIVIGIILFIIAVIAYSIKYI